MHSSVIPRATLHWLSVLQGFKFLGSGEKEQRVLVRNILARDYIRDKGPKSAPNCLRNEGRELFPDSRSPWATPSYVIS